MNSDRTKTTRALGWDLFGNFGNQAISLILSVILARLLSPSEFGLVGMSMVVVAINQVLIKGGFAPALIQSDDTSSLTYSSVFYINVLVSIVMTGIIFIAAPSFGVFFGYPIITEILRWLSISMLLNSLVVVHLAHLNKQMDFKSLTTRSLVAQIAGGTVAIIMALNGFGVFSLVAQNIVTSLVSVIVIWSVVKWKPKLEFSWFEVRKLSKFSLYVFFGSTINKVMHQLDALVIGKFFNADTLGYYNRANGLNNMITQNSSTTLSRVFFPALVKVKSDTLKFDSVFLKVLDVAGTLAVFLSANLYMAGSELIIGLFGQRWVDSVPIFQILILKAFTYPMGVMVINAFMAKGRAKENFHVGNVRKGFQLIPFLFAYTHGLNGYLYSNVVVALFLWIYSAYQTHRILKISMNRQLLSVLPQLAFSLLVVFFLQLIFSNNAHVLYTIMKVGVYSVGYLFFLYYINSPVIFEGRLYWKTIKRKFNV